MRRPAQKCIAVLLLLALCLTLAGCWSDDPAAQGDELIDRIGGLHDALEELYGQIAAAKAPPEEGGDGLAAPPER